jgi:hypothetical protein
MFSGRRSATFAKVLWITRWGTHWEFGEYIGNPLGTQRESSGNRGKMKKKNGNLSSANLLKILKK